MSSPLPPEILDHIVDHLHDEPVALKACCVTSKSWIHRTRVHLFACVEFSALKPYIELWQQAFPDPSNSPARYTRHLSIHGLPLVTTADADAGDWIRAFYNVVHLHLGGLSMDHNVSLIPFHGLSPTLRSLSLSDISSGILDLICSFPLLEDLELNSLGLKTDAWNTPSSSPKLTGSLDLRGTRVTRPVVRRLLDLPDGLHFTKIMIPCYDEDVESTMGLVSRCSATLEYLDVSYYSLDASGKPPLDLSKATKLKELLFRYTRHSVQWIAVALQTVQSKNLQQITIQPYGAIANPVKDTVSQEWQALDHLLVRFWTSHSIRPRIKYKGGRGGDRLKAIIPSLLPELTRRGLIDWVERLSPLEMPHMWRARP